MLGPLMIDIADKQLSNEDKILLRHPLVGAIILFSRNYESQDQLRKLIAEIRREKKDILISVDHEGGRVQRFREGFLRIPPMRALGRYYDDHDPSIALEAAHVLGWALASELLAFGVDFSFTPVLDVDHGVSDIIGDRAFHANPEKIVDLAQAFVLGLSEAGMPSVGKHFPGHGAVAPDSHLEIPVDDRAFSEIEEIDLVPFEALVKSGLTAVMPAHIIYSQVDDKPAGFSKIWLQDILRKKLKFRGVIFSDDLSMEGASAMGDYPSRARAALEAGCDMILACNNRPAVLELISVLPVVHSEIREERLSMMRSQQGLLQSLTVVQAQETWQRAKYWIDLLSEEYL